MDTSKTDVELDEGRKVAGAFYLEALRKLGLEPLALFWAFDRKVNHFVLVLITEFFDFKGPYEISKMLFRAYNAAATPREIDPFIVRLHSPKHAAMRNIRIPTHMYNVDQKTGRPIGEGVELKSATVGDLIVSPMWVYKIAGAPKKLKSVDLSRRWSRFERNVEHLAA